MKILGDRDYIILAVINAIGIVTIFFGEDVGIITIMIVIVYESFYIENEDKLVNVILYYFDKLAPLVILCYILMKITFSNIYGTPGVDMHRAVICIVILGLRTWSAYKDRKRIKEKIASQNQVQS